MRIQPVSERYVSPAVLIALLFACAAFPAWPQQPPPAPPPDQTLTDNQLDDLVAPIALYPDELLSQIMVASTYPLEVVEAYQFLQKNPGVSGTALTQAAQQQNWDPSVQALVMFPDVLKRLNDDVTWTTDLGDAFLAQQQNVMDAVQRMRQQAQKAGKLQSGPQESVSNDGQYIDIEPVDPDVMYVPIYNPAWMWGPALWYPYPTWYWPPMSFLSGGLYWGFGPGINVGLFFGAGWTGWGGWGWHPGWGRHDIVVNHGFIHRYGFNGSHLASVHGEGVWTHNPAHRGGVPYPNARLQSQFRNNVRQAIAPRSIPEAARGGGAGYPNERMGNREIPSNRPSEQRNRSAFSGMEYGGAAATHSEHGFSSMGPARSAPRPAPRMSAPRMSAPRMSAPPRGGRR